MVKVLGKVRIGKVKSVSKDLVKRYGDVFTTEFDTNKKLVYQYSDITGKHLNNRVAGYITRLKVNAKKRADTEAAEAEEVAAIEAPVGITIGAEAGVPPSAEPAEEEAVEDTASEGPVEDEAKVAEDASEKGADDVVNETPKDN